MTEASLIELRKITKTYGFGDAAFQALRGIDLSIRRGEFVAVMGPSGSGKSTLMNLLGCLDTPTSGQYLYQDIAVELLDADQRSLLRRQELGFIFQGFNLLARTSALENVELPMIYRGIPRAERHHLAAEALASVGLPNNSATRHRSFPVVSSSASPSPAPSSPHRRRSLRMSRRVTLIPKRRWKSWNCLLTSMSIAASL